MVLIIQFEWLAHFVYSRTLLFTMIPFPTSQCAPSHTSGSIAIFGRAPCQLKSLGQCYKSPTSPFNTLSCNSQNQETNGNGLVPEHNSWLGRMFQNKYTLFYKKLTSGLSTQSFLAFCDFAQYKSLVLITAIQWSSYWPISSVHRENIRTLVFRTSKLRSEYFPVWTSQLVNKSIVLFKF